VIPESFNLLAGNSKFFNVEDCLSFLISDLVLDDMNERQFETSSSFRADASVNWVDLKAELGLVFLYFSDFLGDYLDCILLSLPCPHVRQKVILVPTILGSSCSLVCCELANNCNLRIWSSCFKTIGWRLFDFKRLSMHLSVCASRSLFTDSMVEFKYSEIKSLLGKVVSLHSI